MLIPTGDYARYTTQAPVRPMAASLFRSGGSWWLEYEDGWQRDTHHKAGRDGFRRREMTRTVCAGENT